MKITLSVFALILCVSFSAQSTPRQIVIIRHGEKIDDSQSDLSPQGCERAYQLPQFFHSYQTDVVAIYAQQARKAGSSIRPLETIAPTAKAVGLNINNKFLRDDTTSIAQEILNSPTYNGKTVFISWEHTAILNLVLALGLQLPANLQKWPSSIFDQAWILNYVSGKPNLSIAAEMALPTDILPAQSGVANWGKGSAPNNNGVIVPAATIRECANGNTTLNKIVKEQVLISVPGL